MGSLHARWLAHPMAPAYRTGSTKINRKKIRAPHPIMREGAPVRQLTRRCYFTVTPAEFTVAPPTEPGLPILLSFEVFTFPVPPALWLPLKAEPL